MSVSFFVEMGTIEGYRVSCMCPNLEGEVFDTYEDAELFLMVAQEKKSTFNGCTGNYCDEMGYSIIAMHDASDTAEINMSNRNAFDVLGYLGIDANAEGWSGAFDPRDLMARADIAFSIAPDSTPIPTVDEGGMILIGRKAGYVQERLSQLIPVCEDAIKLNRQVVWA